MKLAGRLLMFWITAVAIGGGYAGIHVLDATQVSDAQIVAAR